MLGFLRRWTIPIVGGITPVLLIVINVAAFIVQHLDQFRWTVAVLAFLSGIMLNAWTALNMYRYAQRRVPGWALVQEHNQELVLVLGMAAVAVTALASGYFCYTGLGDEHNLPNKLTFLTGVISIATPIILQAFFRRNVRSEQRADLGDGQRR